MVKWARLFVANRIRLVLGLMALEAIAATVTVAADVPALGRRTPIERALNADGTLNTASGFSGSIDMAGYQMLTDPGGAPHFVPERATGQGAAATCDPNQSWDSRCSSSYESQTIFAPATGTPTPLCDADASWDDRFFPAGPDRGISAVAVVGSDVYVGGGDGRRR